MSHKGHCATLDLGLHHRIYRFAIHDARVLAVICFLAKPALVNRTNDGRFDERGVEVFQAEGHGVAHDVDRQNDEGDPCGRPYEHGQRAENLGAYDE